MEYVTRPVRRACGKLPHQKVAKWEREIIQLSKKRVPLTYQRETLEFQEVTLLKVGSTAASTAEKKQTAAEIVRVRKQLRQAKAQETLYTQQIDILSGRAHNVQLKMNAANASVPLAADLAKEAAEAEASIKELTATAEMANSLNVTVDEITNEDEDDILAEFEEVAKSMQPQAEPDEEPTAKTKEAEIEDLNTRTMGEDYADPVQDDPPF